MNEIVFLTLLISFISLTFASSGFGKCNVNPTPNVVQNFDAKNYMGTWYEQYRDESTPFQTGECVTAVYELNEDGTFKVTNSELRSSDERKVVHGKGTCPNAEAKCLVNFGKESSWFSKFTDGNYWVVDTDYTSYSLVYSCNNYLGLYHLEFLWALSREQLPSEETMNNIEVAIKKLGYPSDKIRRRTLQGNTCKYE